MGRDVGNNVFVFVNDGFWQFSLLCTGLPLFAYYFTRLPLFLFNNNNNNNNNNNL